MKDENYIEIRNKLVVKSNDLIQKSRFSLSLLQQKIVLYLISQINPYDDDFKLYEFSIVDFCKVCGIDSQSGDKYRELKSAIKEIADKSLWISIDEDSETLLRWIEKPYINRKDGIIKIRLDSDMKPYLLRLKRNFTTYELIWTLHFRSKYTIRLYELIKSIHYHDLEEYQRQYTVDELKVLLDGIKYEQYRDFKRNVLMPAVKEINQYSDKILDFEEIKKKGSKKVEYILFSIGSKDSTEMLRIRSQIEREMGIDQMTLWELMEDRGLV